MIQIVAVLISWNYSLGAATCFSYLTTATVRVRRHTSKRDKQNIAELVSATQQLIKVLHIACAVPSTVFSDFVTRLACFLNSPHSEQYQAFVAAAVSGFSYQRLEDIFLTDVLVQWADLMRIHVSECLTRGYQPHSCVIRKYLSVFYYISRTVRLTVFFVTELDVINS